MIEVIGRMAGHVHIIRDSDAKRIFQFHEQLQHAHRSKPCFLQVLVRTDFWKFANLTDNRDYALYIRHSIKSFCFEFGLPVEDSRGEVGNIGLKSGYSEEILLSR